jgi:hypothetical protein
MTLTNPFILELCDYIASQSAGRFAFGAGDKNLKVGEIEAGHNGVFAVLGVSEEPDRYTPVEYHTIDFWAVNTDETAGYQDLRTIFQMLHQAYAYNLSSWQIYYSNAQGQIIDFGRNRENKKLFKLTILFISRSLIS